MEKRILNIAIFARLYFEKLGKVYDEKNKKQRESADKNFRRMLKEGKLDPSVFEQIKAEYLQIVEAEISNLIKKE